MNIGEIRIGNILKARDNGRWNTVVVNATFKTFVIAKNRFLHIGSSYDPHQLHGAYFSAEWLEENGFEDTDGNGCEFLLPPHVNDDSTLRLSTDDGNTFSLVSDNGYSRIEVAGGIRSIHSLQNIVHSISGKELLSEQSLIAILAMTAPIIDTHTESE